MRILSYLRFSLDGWVLLKSGGQNRLSCWWLWGDTKCLPWQGVWWRRALLPWCSMWQTCEWRGTAWGTEKHDLTLSPGAGESWFINWMHFLECCTFLEKSSGNCNFFDIHQLFQCLAGSIGILSCTWSRHPTCWSSPTWCEGYYLWSAYKPDSLVSQVKSCFH